MQKLLDRGFQVKALTRSKSKASSTLGKSSLLEIVEVDLKDKQGLIDKGVFEACEGALICTGTTAFPTARCVPCVRVHGHDDYCSCQEYSAYLLRGLHDRILDPHANPRLLYRAPVKTKADSGAGGKETMDLSRPTSYPRRTWSRLFRAR